VPRNTAPRSGFPAAGRCRAQGTGAASSLEASASGSAWASASRTPAPASEGPASGPGCPRLSVDSSTQSPWAAASNGSSGWAWLPASQGAKTGRSYCGGGPGGRVGRAEQALRLELNASRTQRGLTRPPPRPRRPRPGEPPELLRPVLAAAQPGAARQRRRHMPPERQAGLPPRLYWLPAAAAPLAGWSSLPAAPS
jgi:hypothetical protein